MNKPHLVADPGCVYDNQQKTLVASGCGGLPIEWFDGVRQGNPSSRNLNPGIYSARCYSSSSTGTSYGPWEFYEICRIDPNPVVITANKTSVNPLELFELTGSNCVSGGVQWLTPAGEYVWGNTLTAAGPGIYRARCVVSDRSIGAWTSFTMTAKPPGLLTITSNKSRARSNEPVTLTATGCSNGHVMWSYVPNGKTTEVLERGQSITAFGYGTYYAWCVSLGMSGTRADYTVSELTGNIPSVTTDKQMAAPNDPVFVSMSGCSNPEWYWLKVTLPDGRVVYPTTTNGKSVVYGSFTYEAACVNYGGGIDGKTTGSVGLSLVDHLRVVPNKSRVGANESVLLTAYGCDFGKLEWRIGGEIQPAFSGQTSITQVGPGNYYARCRGDLFKSDDWVLAIVNPATDIIPSISSPLRICPNTPTTLSASNCPAGWLYQWFTVERGWNNFNSSTVIQLPQLVKCRCLKPDYSWWGAEQEVNIDASFPSLFTATSNSPVPLGGELKLTVTDISDPTATYKWTPPPGVTLPTTTTRNLTLPNATTSFGGTYEVEVRSGNCQVTAKTEVAVRACEDLYIKSYVPSTGEQTTQLKRKAGVVPMAYESLELSVETLDGQRLPGAAYSWSGPVGVSLPLDASKPFLTQTNQVGKYKATVSFGEGDVCVLETNLSGKPCQVFTDGDCNNTPVGVNTNAEPNENIPNLAVGDVFNAGDYEVTVTSLKEGSQAQGWTGEGMVDQNLIARIKIPMTVEFKKIKINACYQYYNRGENGAVVHTKVDPSWGSVVDLGKDDECGDINVYIRHLQEIADLLKVYTIDNKSKLQTLSDGLIKLEGQLKNDTCFKAEQKNLISSALSNSKTEISCLLTPTSARVRADNCGVNIDENIERNIALLLSAEDKDCNCVPTGVANEGDRKIFSGSKVDLFYGVRPCYKSFIYHSSFSGSKYPSGWYSVEDYKLISTFVKDKISPLIFFHGTFSDPTTFSNDFKRNVFNFIGLKVPFEQAISDFKWSGGNNNNSREIAASDLSTILNSDISKRILKKLNSDKHVILVAHSHGGNVAKLAKNMLESLDPGWRIDVVNIETPQRSDFQFNNSNGIILNLWSDGDLIQWLGTIRDSDKFVLTPGPLGVRKDPKADQNIQLVSFPKLSSTDFGGAMYIWMKTYGGHSLQGDDWFKWQIYYHIKKLFN